MPHFASRNLSKRSSICPISSCNLRHFSLLFASYHNGKQWKPMANEPQIVIRYWQSQHYESFKICAYFHQSIKQFDFIAVIFSALLNYMIIHFSPYFLSFGIIKRKKSCLATTLLLLYKNIMKSMQRTRLFLLIMVINILYDGLVGLSQVDKRYRYYSLLK